MIVSHRHRFVFVKTHKTAGTSLEILLSAHAGPEDILTPIAPEDEELRRSRGGSGPQNCAVPPRRWDLESWSNFLFRGRRRRFKNHTSARQARTFLGRATWEAYHTFTLERNPYDKAVSCYFWDARKPRNRGRATPTLRDYLRTVTRDRLSNYGLYAHRGRILVDEVLRYETLADQLPALLARLGLPAEGELPRAKGQSRPKRSDYRELLGPEERRLVERKCHREIAAFGYEFGGEAARPGVAARPDSLSSPRS